MLLFYIYYLLKVHCCWQRITLLSSVAVLLISLVEECGRNLRYCGQQQIKIVRRALTLKVKCESQTLLIPGHGDNEGQQPQTAAWALSVTFPPAEEGAVELVELESLAQHPGLTTPDLI